MKATCHCGAEWGGFRTSHCTACHQTFNSDAAGDKHRVGEHHLSTGPNRRRCRTEAEMLDLGMSRNERGHWITKARIDSVVEGLEELLDEEGF